MKRFFTLLLIFSAFTISAQTTSDFESISLDPESFLNGEDGSGGFTDGNAFFPNFYNDAFGSWSGWAISNTTDITTPGFMNQYSPITGGGYNGSTNFAVSFIPANAENSGTSIIHLENMAQGEVVNGFYITNGTYPYLSMRDGDSFAKKFGGLNGDDPDFFLLTIKKYLNGTLSTDSIDFYLADYRFEDNSMDYIVDEWTYVDLTSLGAADSLRFNLTSTDNSEMFGMNTPGYFFLDNLVTSDGVVNVSDLASQKSYEVFPNPTTDFLILKSEAYNQVNYTISDVLGNVVLSGITDRQIDVAHLVGGSYLLRLEKEDKLVESHLFIKQ